MFKITVYICCFLILSCKADQKNLNLSRSIQFQAPERINIIGYTGHVMEPFIASNDSILFFNNSNDPTENTNLHWAKKVNEFNFQYQGEITNVNTAYLEGVPTMDSLGNFYFVSIRSYLSSLSSIYQCQFSNGAVNNVQLVQGISKLQAGWINFDAEVTADGQFLYFVDGTMDQYGRPSFADIVIAEKTQSGFQRITNSSAILQNINTDDLEYAACISHDQLELYFTRIILPITNNTSPEIFYATRENINLPFNNPVKINNINGFVEATTVTKNQSILYFHKKENNLFVLYRIKKQ
jgi:hypothetical protein